MRLVIAIGQSWIPRETPRPEDLSELAVFDCARDVARTLRARGHEVRRMTLESDIRAFIRRLRAFGPDAVVNLVEGARGTCYFEPHAAAAMELAGFAITGASFEALALCRRKPIVRGLLAGNGLPVPPGGVATEDERPRVPLPAIVKPANEDGSIGIDVDSVVETEAELDAAIDRLLEDGLGPAVVEQYIDGRELNVSLLGGHEPERVAIGEVLFGDLPPGMPRILTYDGKWVEASADYRTTPTHVPARIPARIQRRVEEVARGAYRVLGLYGYARVDLRLGAGGRSYIIDVNPNPDITPGSGFRKALDHFGIDFGEFLERLAEQAIERRDEIVRANEALEVE